ncbi:DNA-binding transcriptional regulator BolA-like [Pollicipes pollicipes]|uniref:DNA-binding transcriptional regulator BolA-like n=1 Tax=Pollicipes pollicipes TaxID=41117 RepID=UPI001884D674|nr:DNA-binding transcriptional regulator BolA-like [Pollicipes pollicipes]XP_037084190.1 DNA-binding transcriptional regulator BolA-like [Pollicipes pollicipes]XP_037084191.1 DNA-binding transcriptional regulator BolA-like [Pollicipes pollicipes]
MAASGPVSRSIQSKLSQLKPSHLEVINESFMHNVPKGSETHFKVVVVSEAFSRKPPIQRHRLVNGLLRDELAAGVHALSIVAKTPEQWAAAEGGVSPSPKCLGGFGK